MIEMGETKAKKLKNKKRRKTVAIVEFKSPVVGGDEDKLISIEEHYAGALNAVEKDRLKFSPKHKEIIEMSPRIDHMGPRSSLRNRSVDKHLKEGSKRRHTMFNLKL